MVQAAGRIRLGAALLLLAAPAFASDKPAQGKLTWQLHRLASQVEQGVALRAQGRRYVLEDRGLVRAVAELAPGADPAPFRALVEAHGGSVSAEARSLGWLRIDVPPGALRALAQHESVARLRTPYYPSAKEVVGEGAALIQAPELIARSGHDGDGVSVAVLDSGYQFADQLVGTELPADTEITDFVRQRQLGFGSSHGTACAEIVHDVAPGAHLILFGFEDDTTWVEALRQIGDRGIPIVSHSIGFDNIYPPDGHNPFANLIDEAASRGVLIAQAAGNEADRYYHGEYSDADGDGTLEFAGRTEMLPVAAPAGVSRLVLRWDDPFGTAGHDYDLFVVREEFAANGSFEDNPAIVASSQNVQDGSGDPVEVVDYPALADGTFYAVIRRDPSSPVNTEQRFSLWSENGVHPDFRSAAGSLTLPADAQGALAVAAVNLQTELEDFSSRGPTEDGRVKPDVAAPDGVSTQSFGPFGFYGTSAATPHAAGAAALILSRNPGMSTQELRRRVEQATTSGGDEGLKNNDTGYGLLELNRD